MIKIIIWRIINCVIQSITSLVIDHMVKIITWPAIDHIRMIATWLIIDHIPCERIHLPLTQNLTNPGSDEIIENSGRIIGNATVGCHTTSSICANRKPFIRRRLRELNSFHRADSLGISFNSYFDRTADQPRNERPEFSRGLDFASQVWRIVRVEVEKVSTAARSSSSFQRYRFL
jgi:hypothetical protein